MRHTIQSLYIAGAVVGLLATVLILADLARRFTIIKKYTKPVGASMSLRWNVDSNVVQTVISVLDVAEREARLRAELNALHDQIDEERVAREQAEDRVAALAGAGDNLWRLGLLAALGVLGLVLNSAASILGSYQ